MKTDILHQNNVYELFLGMCLLFPSMECVCVLLCVRMCVHICIYKRSCVLCGKSKQLFFITVFSNIQRGDRHVVSTMATPQINGSLNGLHC